jgi:hypothetical protein
MLSGFITLTYARCFRGNCDEGLRSAEQAVAFANRSIGSESSAAGFALEALGLLSGRPGRHKRAKKPSFKVFSYCDKNGSQRSSFGSCNTGPAWLRQIDGWRHKSVHKRTFVTCVHKRTLTVTYYISVKNVASRQCDVQEWTHFADFDQPLLGVLANL